VWQHEPRAARRAAPQPRPRADARRPACAGIDAFVRAALCAALGADCETVWLATLDDRSARGARALSAVSAPSAPAPPAPPTHPTHRAPRRLTALESGAVDVVVEIFTVTPEREARVRFVRPFYALEGGVLWELPEVPLAPPPAAWADLAGEKVCYQAGNYLGEALRAEGAELVAVERIDDYAAAIREGRCAAAAADDYSPAGAGLAAAALPPLAAAPYGVAVSRGAAADGLALRVSGAMVGLLTGPDAPLVAEQRRAFAAIGVAPNPAVAQLSRALTTMDACAPGEGGEAAASAAPRRRVSGTLAAALAAAAAALL
jgi:ABC-type amino acid transport substrate-binding protein